MEIGPIPGIRIEAIGKVQPKEPELPAVFDVGRLLESTDDTWSGDERKAAGGQDNEEDEAAQMDDADDLDEASEEEPELPPVEQPVKSDSSAQVNYFA